MTLMSPVRVVVIDDRHDHLFAIANALSQSGIPCVWHLYDKMNSCLIPPAPVGGYSDIRLVITDLNIRDFSTADPDAKNLAGTLLSEVLLPILPNRSTPYGLVLWSSVQGVVDEVRTVILERIDSDRMPPDDRRPKPLSIQLMNKGKFVSELKTGSDTTAPDTLITEAAKYGGEIREQLGAALADPQLRLVCAWETRVSKAATATVNEIYAAAVEHARSQANCDPTIAFRDILAKIANEAAGSKNAMEDPARALDDGLIDLFVDDLRSNSDDINYLKLIEDSLKDKLGKRIDLSQSVRHQLNTTLHAETKAENWGENISRGIVLGADDQEKIANRLGYETASCLIWNEFLFPALDFKIAARRAKGKTNESILKENSELAKSDETEVLNQCRLRLVEIGADCDHANRKTRTVRLLCALEVPERFAHFVRSPQDGKSYKSEAVMEWGPWNLDQREGLIFLVSVKRFSIEQTWPLPEDLKPKYRLRRQIIDVVLRKYADHSSRLGYVAIN
jgi:hypothetical protein